MVLLSDREQIIFSFRRLLFHKPNSQPLITFPNCKINLGLHILQKRADGFHDLETVFYPLPFTDALEVVHQQQSSADEVTLSASGIAIDAAPQQNICIKAYDLLKKDYPSLPPVQMHLHKCVPTGAGLGGGSADGAFTLKLLNEKFRLSLSTGKLLAYALALGSDCPFFILNQPCVARGRGEQLHPVEVDLSNYKVVLIYPNIHINTAWAFSKIQPADNRSSIADIIRLPASEWKAQLTNDFEPVVFEQYPEIKKIKQDMYAAGAVFASLSGSGSTVFGLFAKDTVTQLEWPESYFVKSI